MGKKDDVLRTGDMVKLIPTGVIISVTYVRKYDNKEAVPLYRIKLPSGRIASFWPEELKKVKSKF